MEIWIFLAVAFIVFFRHDLADWWECERQERILRNEERAHERWIAESLAPGAGIVARKRTEELQLHPEEGSHPDDPPIAAWKRAANDG